MNNTVWIELDKPFNVDDFGEFIRIKNIVFKVLKADGDRVLCEGIYEVGYE